jgi:hypothetical protein
MLWQVPGSLHRRDMHQLRPQRRRLSLVLFLVAALATATGGATESQTPISVSFPGPALELVRDDTAFFSFARQLSREADRLLATPGATPAEQKSLLGLRVHLALCLHEDDIARAAADRLRALQTDLGERAHSGVLTRALIESRRDPTVLEPTLLAALKALPRDPEVRSVVQRSAARIAAFSESSLLAEIRNDVSPKLARGEPCTLEMADQIVRAGHRVRNILPLRAAILRAYEAALATWP